MRVILAAGGTAGHINPALAIADEIRNIFPESVFLFVGTPNGMEGKLVKEAGYDFVTVKSERLRRRITPQNIVMNAKAFVYFFSAQTATKRIIKQFKPDIVIGTGGYISAPVLIEAAKLKIKTVTHESNSLPGVATKMAAKVVDKIFVSTADTITHLKQKEKCIITGNPLRVSIPIVPKEQARAELKLPAGFTVLSFGGSLGANKVSYAVGELIKWEQMEGGINHIHAYGGNGKPVFMEIMQKNNVDTASKRLLLSEYIYNMYTCMCASDLVIARAGSMSLAEITAIGLPSILIPFPEAAENHQYYNALTMQKEGASILLLDKDLTGKALIDIVQELSKNSKRIAEMSKKAKRLAVPDAASRIMSEIVDLLK